MSDDLVKRLRVDDPWCQPKCDEAADRIEELEAKLAKAVTELKMFTDVSNLMQSATSHNKHRHNTVITDTMWAQWSKQLRFALSTLAELKGQDDD